MSECYNTAERKELEGDFSDSNDYLYNYYSKLCGIMFIEGKETNHCTISYREGQTISFDWRSNYTSGNGFFHFFDFNQEKVMILHKILLNHFRLALRNVHEKNMALAKEQFLTCKQICNYVSNMKAVKSDFVPGRMSVEMSLNFNQALACLFLNMAMMCSIDFSECVKTSEFYRNIYYSTSCAAEQVKRELDASSTVPSDIVGSELYLSWAQCRFIALYHEANRLGLTNQVKEVQVGSDVCDLLVRDIIQLEEVYEGFPIKNLVFEENIIVIKEASLELKKRYEKVYCEALYIVPMVIHDYELGKVAKRYGINDQGVESGSNNNNSSNNNNTNIVSWKPFKPFIYPISPPSSLTQTQSQSQLRPHPRPEVQSLRQTSSSSLPSTMKMTRGSHSHLNFPSPSPFPRREVLRGKKTSMSPFRGLGNRN